MTIVTDTFLQPIPACVATIGCFDGVHRGHRYLIEQVCDEARVQEMVSALITFPVHPRQVMQSEFRPQWLTSLEQKKELLANTPADYCIMLPFTKELSLLSARDFMRILAERYHIRTLVIGYDHRFGHNRSEGFDDYCHYGKEMGMDVICAKALTEDGISISSSLIRRLLKDGQTAQANHYLGYNYFIDGTVVTGAQVGRTLGFPTANLCPLCPEKLIPHVGVYAAIAHMNGTDFPAMLNIGHRPTIDNGANLSIEAHIIGFSGDLYGKKLRIELIDYLRPEQKFEDRKQLTIQLTKDRQRVLQVLSNL